MVKKQVIKKSGSGLNIRYAIMLVTACKYNCIDET